MPRFYFHFDRPNHPSPDHDGLWMPNLAAASDWAVSALRDLRDDRVLPLGFDPIEVILTIADEKNRPLKRIAARDVLATH
jgi:hypothetical protein